ncbi:MAG: YcxB family protein [Oscillospiraceae bacterium]|nr:YcxB family protein [Oscillospiraceae bacterium]
MEDFTLNIKLNTEDSKRLFFYSLFKRNVGTAVMMAAFLLFFVLMPSYWFFMGAVRLNFGVLLTIYVASVWCLIFSSYFRIKKTTYYGEGEYRFSEDGLCIFEKYAMNFIPRNELFSCEESAEMFLIFTGKSVAYLLPKRDLTVYEGENIRRYFGNKLQKKGKLSDEKFGGQRCEGFFFDDESVISEAEIIPDKGYIKTVAAARYFTFDTVSKAAMMFAIIAGIGVTAFRSYAFPVVSAAAFLVITSVINLQTVRCSLEGHFAKNSGKTSVIFRDSCFEFVCGNRTDRVFYSEITDVKYRKGAAEVKSSHGGSIFLPRVGGITAIMEERRNGKG